MFKELFPVFGLSAAVLIVASGLRLTCTGRPFGTVPLAMHKLVALGTFIWLGVALFRGDKATVYSSLDLGTIGLAGLLWLGTFVTGGVAIVFEPVPTRVVWVHRIGSWIALAAAAWCLRLVVG